MAESRADRTWAEKLKGSRVLRWVVGIPVALALVLYAASFFLDEPLRSNMEKNMNRDLKGYTVRLPELKVRLSDLSVTLKGLSIYQKAHPDHPVVFFPVLKASTHWRDVLTGRLVAEFILDKPNININLMQLRSEATSKVPLKERGWQQAVEDIYPLKINSLKINDASITYVDQDQKKPLILSHLNLQGTNIRNINLPDNVYPSAFYLDTSIFDSGRCSIDGKANFLAKPLPGLKGSIKLENVPLDYFTTLIAGTNVSIKGGVLHASGDAEYAPNVKIAHLKNLEIQGMKMEYIHTQATAAAEKKRAAIVEKAARKLSNKPGLVIRADNLYLTGCTLGFVNKATSKPYRVFLADTDLHLSNLSNHFSEGPAKARLKAKFMGSGSTTATVNFRPDKGKPDLDIFLKINDSQLTAMNDLLRTYGDFDVSAGIFSLVTELHIKNETITGYIKPLFKDMKVYDRRTDDERGLSHQMHEIMVGGVAMLLENRVHQEIGARVDITGKVGNPETSTLQIVMGLIRNAFFKAIMPSFEKKPEAMPHPFHRSGIRS